MIKNEEYIDYLEKVISCINNADYYSVKELSILKLNTLKEENIIMKKRLHKYIVTNISNKRLKNLKEEDFVNLYIEYLFSEIKEDKELKKIVSIEEFIHGVK